MQSETSRFTFSPGASRIGVVGAGTMGAGIALTVLYAGLPVVLQDISETALEKAREYIESHLNRKGLGQNLDLLSVATGLESLAGSGIVIEAALEDLDLKKVIFAELGRICPAGAILATNTSTLSVSAISSVTADPSRVAGLHFFNPAPVLPLVEVVRGSWTSDETLARLYDFAVFLGKTPVVTRDSPGFIVNRVARPFYGEALRMLAEGVAGVEGIDLLAEAGAGFRLGPFRLMDLIGIDINYTAMRSMYEQTFGEPRYRPHWIQASMAASGALGRKSGRGFYSYGGDEPEKSPASPLEASAERGTIWLAPGSWAPSLAGLCHEAGYELSPPLPGAPHPVLAVLPAGRFEGHPELLRLLEMYLTANTPILCQAADQTLSEMRAGALHPERLLGFDGLFLRSGGPITLTRSGPTLAEASQSAEDLVRALGCTPVWVEDSPALVLPRLLATLVNEATFAILEQVADSATVDLAMRLGVNYPKGPIEWGSEIGMDKILAILEHLRSEYGEERYRASTLLRRSVRLDFSPSHA